MRGMRGKSRWALLLVLVGVFVFLAIARHLQWRAAARTSGAAKVGMNGFGGPKDGSHTPWGKPAMDVIGRWYAKDER